jgi:hypothetical protein
VQLVGVDRLMAGKSESPGGSESATVTDFNGQYELTSIDPGTYIVNAMLDGYSSDFELVRSVLDHYSADQRKALLAEFPQVVVRAGAESQKDVVIRRGAAISGHVSVDLGGTPGHTAVVASMISSSLIDPSSNAEATPVSYSRSGATDDRGFYRIAGLPAGKYRLSVHIKQQFFSVRQISGGNWVPVPLRPGVADLTVFAAEALNTGDAKLFEVKDADDIEDADITVPARLLHSIAGTVTVRGMPTGGIGVSVKPMDGQPVTNEAVSTPDGYYRFDLLPPGSYTVQAKPLRFSQLGTKDLAGQVSIGLDQTDVLDANIELQSEANR